MWTKPIDSVRRMRNKYTSFYYLTLVNIKKISSQCKVARPHWLNSQHQESAYWYDKTTIDKFPRHLRRGGQYGHDAVQLKKHTILGPTSYYTKTQEKKEVKKMKLLCNAYGLNYVVTEIKH